MFCKICGVNVTDKDDISYQRNINDDVTKFLWNQVLKQGYFKKLWETIIT